MKLVLFRHGIAEDREEFAQSTKRDDSLRPLTWKGRKKHEKVCETLKTWVKDIDLIVSSPYTRAKQSAYILSEIWLDIPVVDSAELIPQCPPEPFVKWLRMHGKAQEVIVAVGHEPQLSTLAAHLLFGRESANTGVIELKKSGALCLKIDSWGHLSEGCAKLLWHWPPNPLI